MAEGPSPILTTTAAGPCAAASKQFRRGIRAPGALRPAPLPGSARRRLTNMRKDNHV